MNGGEECPMHQAWTGDWRTPAVPWQSQTISSAVWSNTGPRPHRRRRTPGPVAPQQGGSRATSPRPVSSLIDRGRAYVQAKRVHNVWVTASYAPPTCHLERGDASPSDGVELSQSAICRIDDTFSSVHTTSLMGPVHPSLSYANVFISSYFPLQSGRPTL